MYILDDKNWNVAKVSCGEMWIRWLSLRSANAVKSWVLSERCCRRCFERLSAENNTNKKLVLVYYCIGTRHATHCKHQFHP